ncbi:MAG: SusC/RagA family TonB-linked outer membrane protein [Muribaculaceae bacterium]|nr:SusC/RagA family TonB-linked outer membrane protein [Muribaculaceae bacterium]
MTKIKLTSKREKGGIFLRKTFLTLVAMLLAIPAFAQNIDVSGTVVDVEGEPLIGATVMIAGTSNGTATDLDGNYSLKNVPSKGKIIFSYIGYNSLEVDVKGQSKIDVVLTDNAELLEEVVVVGYGVMKRSDLTGAVSTVGTEKLNSKGAASILEALQGTTPGVSITKSTGRTNGSINVEIRGRSSINAGTTPLYVVDGVMCDDIDFLNPQDIERIDVQKDASSTAIYGSRGTAGVIIVTTKGGLNVKKNQKATVTYDGYYGVNKASHKPHFMMGQDWYYYRFGKFLEPMGGSNNFAAQTSQWMKPASYGLGQALLQQQIANLQSPYVMKQLLAEGKTTDWIDLVTRTGQQQNHYVSVAGSSETVNYHFGLGYNGEEGMYKGDSQNTVSFKGSVDARINKVISAGFNFNLAQVKNGYADGDAISQAYRVNPYMIPFTETGEIQHFPGNKNTLGTDDHQFSDFINPLDRMRNSTHKKTTYRALGNVYLQLNFLPELYFKSTFSPSYSSYREGQYVGYINPETGKTYVDNDNRSATVVNKTVFGWTWDNMFNYNKTFNDIHSVGAMFLISSNKSSGEEYKWVTSDPLLGSDWWNMGTGTFNADDSKSSYTENSMISYAFRVNYGFKERYLFTATMRWDGSSRLAPGHRWHSFPSVAAAWRADQEAFLRDVNWITNLKLRLSYGWTGNNKGIGNYDYMVAIGGPVYYPFGSTWYNGLYANGIVDKSLTWETSKEWNLGLDFGFLRDRITGTIEVYQKNSSKLLYNVDLPLEAGGVKMKTNIGKVQNRGVEISLTTINIDNSNFTWSTTFTFNHNNNKVKEINGVSDQYIDSNATKSLFIGYPANNIYQYVWDGVVSDRYMTVPDHQCAIDNGFTPGSQVREYDYYYKVYGVGEGQPKVQDLNGNGQIDDGDKKIFSADPKWQGNITSNMMYRLPKNGGSIDFGFNIYIKDNFWVNSSFLNGDYYDLHDRGRGKMQMDYYIPAGTLVDAEGINPDGTLKNPIYQTTTHYGKYPMLSGGTNDGLGPQQSFYQTARGLTKVSFAKVKNITLGYNFSPNLLKAIGCQNLRLYCTITNPFVFTKYPGFDPEWAAASGKDDGPSVISYQFGASIKF